MWRHGVATGTASSTRVCTWLICILLRRMRAILRIVCVCVRACVVTAVAYQYVMHGSLSLKHVRACTCFRRARRPARGGTTTSRRSRGRGGGGHAPATADDLREAAHNAAVNFRESLMDRHGLQLAKTQADQAAQQLAQAQYGTSATLTHDTSPSART